MRLHLTKEQAIAAHRKMWNWIADETEKQERVMDKSDYFEMHQIAPDDRPLLDCYACEYGAELAGSEAHQDRCRFCPLCWGSRADNRMCVNVSPRAYNWYGDWLRANNWKEAAEIARRIAEVPESNEEQENIYL